MSSKAKSLIFSILPWLITAVAVYFVCRDLDFAMLWSHLSSTNPFWLMVAVFFTSLSYLVRAYRWEYFFPERNIEYLQAAKILILGFFMNNILPARTGELVRAHTGAKVTGEKRTLVLATIASERLVDGIVLSLMFIVLALGAGSERFSTNLLYVAALFGTAALGVVLVLLFREKVIDLIDRFDGKFDSKATGYASNRLKLFVHGLSPLCNKRILPWVCVTSLLIWFVELAAYIVITWAYDFNMPFSHCVLFLVAVNFSSLIPSAPGAIGVIEAITTAILVAVGVPKELALSMVLTQHLIQYLVVGIPGAYVMVTWKKKIKEIKDEPEE